jgi:hypothetical protein
LKAKEAIVFDNMPLDLAGLCPVLTDDGATWSAEFRSPLGQTIARARIIESGWWQYEVMVAAEEGILHPPTVARSLHRAKRHATRIVRDRWPGATADTWLSGTAPQT